MDEEIRIVSDRLIRASSTRASEPPWRCRDRMSQSFAIAPLNRGSLNSTDVLALACRREAVGSINSVVVSREMQQGLARLNTPSLRLMRFSPMSAPGRKRKCGDFRAFPSRSRDHLIALRSFAIAVPSVLAVSERETSRSRHTARRVEGSEP